jgi:hypothetical protein
VIAALRALLRWWIDRVGREIDRLEERTLEILADIWLLERKGAN